MALVSAFWAANSRWARPEPYRVPHFTQQFRGSVANVGFLGSMLEFRLRFGIDRDLCREVGFEAHFGVDPLNIRVQCSFDLYTDPYLDRASGPVSRRWHAVYALLVRF